MKKQKIIINKKTELRNKDKRSRADMLELTELNKTIRREVREDIKNYDLEIVQEIIKESWSTKKTNKSIKKSQYLLSSIKSVAQNTLIYNRQEIVKEASKFYSELYSDARPNRSNKKEIDLIPQTKSLIEEDLLPPIQKDKVLKILKHLKTSKMAGTDKIENSSLKSLKESLGPFLAKIFNQILDTGLTPKQLHSSEIILLHKKGDKRELNNYRPISLTSNINKVFLKVIKARFYKALDFEQPKEQAGFRQGFSL